MAPSDADLWHQVHAQRDDGVAAMFLIRDVEPRTDQPQLIVIEMPYPVTDLSKLPDAAGYRRLDAFQEQWIEPACEALGWTFVAWKSEDGSFFLYLYGDGDTNALLEKLAPFDDDLGFFNDHDADWSEYAALRELVDQAQADPDAEHDHVHTEDCAHAHAPDAASHGISVIDLTGEPPPAETAAATPAPPPPVKAKPTETAPTKTAPTRAPKPPKTPKAAQAATAKSSKATATQPRPAKAASKATATKATKKRADVRQPHKPSATGPKTAKRSAAKKSTTNKPAASRHAKPRATRR